MSDQPPFPLYQVHTLGALASPGDGACGLDGLEPWLDHVADLGCRGLLLTPIFTSETHGYDTVDPFSIDTRLGDDAAFDRLAQRCSDRRIGLVLDGVFNHVGRTFPRFAEVVAQGPQVDAAAWFHIDPSADDGDGFGYRCFEGHRRLVTLDHQNPAVLDWATDVATHWLDRGATGWRFDAAYAIPRSFLSGLTGRIRDRHPSAYLFGEVIHGDYTGFVTESGLDAVTQYELHKAIWSSLRDGNFFELSWALQRHAEFSTGFVPVTFAGNHDVTRIASQVGEIGGLVAAAAALLFTLPGHPCVYYGDEFGWTGIKEHREGGDDAIRPPLPSSPADAVAALDRSQRDLLEVHRSLATFRAGRPWLDTGSVSIEHTANRSFAYTVTAPGTASAVRVLLDLDDSAELPASENGWRPVIDRPVLRILER